jgi:hypothetical protein
MPYEMDLTFDFAGTEYKGYGVQYPQQDISPEDPIIIGGCSGFPSIPPVTEPPCVDPLILDTNVLDDGGMESYVLLNNPPASGTAFVLYGDSDAWNIPDFGVNDYWRWQFNVPAPPTGKLLDNGDWEYYVTKRNPRSGDWHIAMYDGGGTGYKLLLTEKRVCNPEIFNGTDLGGLSRYGDSWPEGNGTPFYTAVVEPDRTLTFSAWVSASGPVDTMGFQLGFKFYKANGTIINYSGDVHNGGDGETSFFITYSYAQYSRARVVPNEAKYCVCWLNIATGGFGQDGWVDVDDMSVVVS